MTRAMEKYLRPGVKGTPFCPGCGHGILMGLILRAIDDLRMDMKKIVFVSGIGCAAWIRVLTITGIPCNPSRKGAALCHRGQAV